MRSRVELFEQIRRDHDREELSIHKLARRHSVHRRTVRQALASPLPPPRKRPERRTAPKLGPYRALIDSWLIADREAPRKQRHTARRIWQRLVSDHGANVAERTVREYVAQRKRELGLVVGEVFVPLCHEPAAEAEVDWGEAMALVAGQPTRVYLFMMRACFSGACFAQAYARQTQQAFLEAQVDAFEFFGGVFFELIRYDNLNAAVAKVLKGRRRVECDRFVALRSHYLFESSFTRAGKEGAHEKGGIEGEVGRFRRCHLVPVPHVASLSALNDLLAAACVADLSRTIRGRSETVGEALGREMDLLRPLPAERFDTAEHAHPRVDAKALATVRQNRYSLPVSLAGLRVSAQIGASEIVFHHDGDEVARHGRLDGRYGTCVQLDHYLELLRQKPGALERSLALRQERERGAWPECFDSLWRAIESRVGSSEAARQMVDVLLLCRELPAAQVELAVRGALAAGAHDGRAVALRARRTVRQVPAPLLDLDERLLATARAEPHLTDYDQLLGGVR
jgi:transposase